MLPTCTHQQTNGINVHYSKNQENQNPKIAHTRLQALELNLNNNKLTLTSSIQEECSQAQIHQPSAIYKSKKMKKKKIEITHQPPALHLLCMSTVALPVHRMSSARLCTTSTLPPSHSTYHLHPATPSPRSSSVVSPPHNSSASQHQTNKHSA